MVILEQEVALLLQHRLDWRREHSEHARQQHFHPDPGLLDVDRRLHRIAERVDVEVELIGGPAGLHFRPAGDILFELVDVVGDAPPRLVLAEAVGEVDFDRL